MPKFNYRAQDGAGKLVRGSLYSADEGELHHKLRGSGLFLLSGKVDAVRTNVRVFKPAVLSDFNRQLSQLTGSGISLVRAMNIMIQEEAISPRQRAVYEDILRLIRQGLRISEALEAQDAFPPLMISMYRAAEAGGSLEATAGRLAVKYDREHRLNLKIKNATAYTKVLSVLTVFVLIVMFTAVLPRFEGMFKNITLPASTKMLFAIRDLFKYHWSLVLPAASILLLTLHILAGISSVSLFLDRLKLQLPVVGSLMRTIYTARFARTLSSLYAAGLPVVSALQTARDTIGNGYIRQQFDGVITEVRGGGSLSSAIEKVRGFSKKMSASVHIGEETGTLDSMLSSVSEVLEYEAEISMTKMVGFLEPILIIVMAGIVGFIVISIITPVFNSYSALGAGSYN